MLLTVSFAVLFTIASCALAPTATQNPATLHRETAVRQFNAAPKELAGPCLADGTQFIHEYDKGFLAHVRGIRIAAPYYAPGIFELVPNGGASNQFLSAGRDPNRYYGDYSPSYYGTIINREFIDESWEFGDRNDLFAVAVMLHEVGRMEGKRNASIKNAVHCGQINRPRPVAKAGSFLSRIGRSAKGLACASKFLQPV